MTNKKTIYLIGFGSLAFIAMCVIVFLTFFNKLASDNNKTEPLVYTYAKDVETAVLWHSEELLKIDNFNKPFDGVVSTDKKGITDTKLTECRQIDKLTDLTAVGTVYFYELLYKVKTDNPNILFENKISGDLVEPDIWLDDVIGTQSIVLFELDNIYYNVRSWSILTLEKWRSDDWYNTNYGRSNNSPKDVRVCQIIQEIYKNPKKIPNFEISPTLSSDSVLRKLLRDIVINAKTDFGIDFDKSRVYGFTYDYGIDAIYFRADLVNVDGEYLVDNIGFSLFLNGGFSIGERELLPVIEELKTKWIVEDGFVSKPITDMDYIKINGTNEIIKISKVKTIEPAIWKGSKDGVLYYKDGSMVEIELSNYGNFFCFKGQRPALFSNEIIYNYNYDDE